MNCSYKSLNVLTHNNLQHLPVVKISNRRDQEKILFAVTNAAATDVVKQ